MRRDWQAARTKVDAERCCRCCGSVMRVEAAHTLGREHDEAPPLRGGDDWRYRRPTIVHPDRIIPLCGPATDTTTCHGKQHAGRLDVLRLLTLDEQLQAVADAGSIEAARVRLIPRRLREAA